MDWQKRTAQRQPLRDAAAEGAGKAPGQALLASLQASEAVRKERYLGTVAAKMKRAREQLPSVEVKHSPVGDAALLHKEHAAEVHALRFDVDAKQVSEAGQATRQVISGRRGLACRTQR